MSKKSNKYVILLIYFALAMTTLAAFWQVQNCDFIELDDPLYVDNQHVKAGLTRDSIVWAFTTTHGGYRHPLSFVSHMLDFQLFGLDAGRHHLTNLLLHIANVLLLFTVLKRMTGAVWRSAFVAAVFAVHPLNVESVAWVTERKDVLSTLFWMLTMVAYTYYVKRRSAGWYVLTLVIFALGLMAKPMLVTLPFVLLLLDYWPLGRFELGERLKTTKWSDFYRLVLEKVPFFAITVVSSVITFVELIALVEQKIAGETNMVPISFGYRLANALVSYIHYIGKMFYPTRLAILYPHPMDSLPLWQGVISFILLAGVTTFVIYMARHRKYLIFGWLWYLGILVPVIGLVQVGHQAMADRFTYLPSIGISIIAAWGLFDMLAKWQYHKIALGASALIVLSTLSICTYFQVRHWQNHETLFEHALDVTENNYFAHTSLAEAYRKRGKINLAMNHNYQALQIQPGYPQANHNLASAFALKGENDKAVLYYRRAIVSKPNYFKAHNNLARTLLLQGKTSESIDHFREAIRLKPDRIEPMNDLAWLLATTKNAEFRDPQQAISLAQRACELTNYQDADSLNVLTVAYAAAGRFDQANSYLQRTIQLKPDMAADSYFILAIILQDHGKIDEAISHYRKAVQFNPDHARAHNNLAHALLVQDKIDEAVKHFRQVLRLKPNSVAVLNRLARLSATSRDSTIYDPQQAVLLAQQVCELTGYKEPNALDTLSVAYAAAGRFPEAVGMAEKALKRAKSVAQKELTEDIQNRLNLFKAGKPYVEEAEK